MFEKYPIKIKAKDMRFVISINNRPTYPEEGIHRRKKYCDPLFSIFYPYFEEIGVDYCKDQNEHLAKIIVLCFKARIEFAPTEGVLIDFSALNAGLIFYRIISPHIVSFFEGLGLSVSIDEVGVFDETFDPISQGFKICGLNATKPIIVKNKDGDYEITTNELPKIILLWVKGETSIHPKRSLVKGLQNGFIDVFLPGLGDDTARLPANEVHEIDLHNKMMRVLYAFEASDTSGYFLKC